MTPETFVARRRPGWEELEAGIARARGGALREVPSQQLERFGVLYRRAASDLAVARRDFPDDPVTDYLNGLCARAHPLLYRGAPLRLGALLGFFATGLPRAFRAAAPYLLASLGLTLAGAVAGWVAVVLRPDIAATLIPDSLFDKMARGEVPTGADSLPGGAGFEASLIIQNNIRVCLVAFCGGLLLGLPTVYILLANGWMLGTLAAAVHHDGFDLPFWSFIAPHGVIELSVVVIAGATGLLLADSILRPGLQARGQSLALAGRRAVGLAVGAACLLVVAGSLEGFVSPTGIAEGAKYAIGAATGVALYSWLLLAGRERKPAAPLSLDRVAA